MNIYGFGLLVGQNEQFEYDASEMKKNSENNCCFTQDCQKKKMFNLILHVSEVEIKELGRDN